MKKRIWVDNFFKISYLRQIIIYQGNLIICNIKFPI